MAIVAGDKGGDTVGRCSHNEKRTAIQDSQGTSHGERTCSIPSHSSCALVLTLRLNADVKCLTSDTRMDRFVQKHFQSPLTCIVLPDSPT
jgi:hypothetical protein